MKLLNGSAVQTMTRITSEYSAKTYNFDITHIRGLFLMPLRKRQIIAAYRSPQRDALRPGFKDNDGYFNALFTQGQLFLVNKNLLKPQDYPKSIEDLLLPKWKGLLGMDDESYDWIAALMDYLRRGKGQTVRRTIGPPAVESAQRQHPARPIGRCRRNSPDGRRLQSHRLSFEIQRRAHRTGFSRALCHRQNSDRSLDRRSRAPST